MCPRLRGVSIIGIWGRIGGVLNIREVSDRKWCPNLQMCPDRKWCPNQRCPDRKGYYLFCR